MAEEEDQHLEERPPDPPPGRANTNQDIREATKARTSAQAAAGQAPPKPTQMKPYAELVQEAKEIRNILEIKITKISSTQEPVPKQDNQLSFDSLADFLFSTLNIDPSNCLTFNHSLGNNSCKELSFKPGVIIDGYVGNFNICQGQSNFNLNTKKQQCSTVRLTVKNCPLNIPDQEILHIANTFCKPVDNIIHYETLSNVKAKGLKGGTRYLEVELKPGAVVPNFFWLSGPLDGDQGARVTVLHGGGQPRQCFNCLKIGSECKADGRGKVCSKDLKTPRARMAEYVETLRTRYHYISLKSQHTRQWPAAGEKKKSDIPEYDEEVEQEEEETTETENAKALRQQLEEEQKARNLEALNVTAQLEKLRSKKDSPAKDTNVKLHTKSEQKVTAAEQKSNKKKQAEKDRKEKQTSEHLAQAFEMLASPELTEENIALIVKEANLELQEDEEGHMLLSPSTFLQSLEAKVRKEKPNLMVSFEETKNLMTLRLMEQSNCLKKPPKSRIARSSSFSRASGPPPVREHSVKRKNESGGSSRQTKPRSESTTSPVKSAGGPGAPSPSPASCLQ